MKATKVGVVGISAVLLTLLMSTAVAAGQNQYGQSFPISACGYIHGAFANINGNFSWISTYAVADHNVSSTGSANSGASVECVAQMGH